MCDPKTFEPAIDLGASAGLLSAQIQTEATPSSWSRQAPPHSACIMSTAAGRV
jgi:hypothetical protein